MRVFGLNIPTAADRLRSIELSREARHRLTVLEWYWTYGGKGRSTCRHFGISPDTFYRWKRRFEGEGQAALKMAGQRTLSCKGRPGPQLEV